MRCWPSHDTPTRSERRRTGQAPLQALGIREDHQVGSHVILQTQTPAPHRVAVPAHDPLRIGTLNGILSSIAVHKDVPKEAILKGIK